MGSTAVSSSLLESGYVEIGPEIKGLFALISYQKVSVFTFDLGLRDCLTSLSIYNKAGGQVFSKDHVLVYTRKGFYFKPKTTLLSNEVPLFVCDPPITGDLENKEDQPKRGSVFYKLSEDYAPVVHENMLDITSAIQETNPPMIFTKDAVFMYDDVHDDNDDDDVVDKKSSAPAPAAAGAGAGAAGRKIKILGWNNKTFGNGVTTGDIVYAGNGEDFISYYPDGYKNRILTMGRWAKEAGELKKQPPFQLNRFFAILGGNRLKPGAFAYKAVASGRDMTCVVVAGDDQVGFEYNSDTYTFTPKCLKKAPAAPPAAGAPEVTPATGAAGAAGAAPASSCGVLTMDYERGAVMYKTEYDVVFAKIEGCFVLHTDLIKEPLETQPNTYDLGNGVTVFAHDAVNTPLIVGATTAAVIFITTVLLLVFYLYKTGQLKKRE